MEITIKNAILHVLDKNRGKSILSNEELDIDSEVCTEFITKHIKKLISNQAAKEASFNPGSKVYEQVMALKSGSAWFKEASRVICELLDDIVSANEDIPAGDALITQFEIDRETYLAILKLNYKECYTHQINASSGGSDNQIVKYHAVLPFDSGKVEEACLIPYDRMIIRLLEKKYPINGEDVNYFSELFLDCAPEMSQKEITELISEITDEVNQKYYGESVDTPARIKAALIEEAAEAAEDDGYVSMENVALRAFADNEEAKNEYIMLARDVGLRQDLKLSDKYAASRLGTQRFKADNGIELKFPVDLAEDTGVIEFVHNSDGSVSIMLKNLRRA